VFVFAYKRVFLTGILVLFAKRFVLRIYTVPTDGPTAVPLIYGTHFFFLLSQVKFILSPKQRAKQKTSKRAKDSQCFEIFCCEVGVAPPGFEALRRMSRVPFRVLPAGRASDARAAILLSSMPRGYIL
jgi:hypothetical protein